uniref:AAA+ ATPase domain-containing protein n=1 Tax=Panagrolaimus sp. JU765 TaxID=591449 RepID=A0AC34REU4_9BILA
MIGRESEYELLKQTIEEGLKSKNPLSLYISGAPGTGKTATTKSVLKDLKNQKKFCSIFINCVKLTKRADVESAILAELELPTSKSVKDFKAVLNTLKKKVVIVLDEVDHLITRRNNTLLYEAYGWPRDSNSKVIVVGIANSLDLTERLLPKLKIEGISPKTFIFQPYKTEQIIAILKNYLKEQTFDEKAIELCSRKVASQTGDIRIAFSIVDKVLHEIEETENVPTMPNMGLVTPKKNNVQSVAKLFKKVQSSPASRATLPEHSKIFLAILIRLVGDTKAQETTRIKLMAAYEKACNILKISAIENEQRIQALDNLETMGIIRISGVNQATKVKFIDEITQARAKICDHVLVASIDEINF